jgi:hypothetical protein
MIIHHGNACDSYECEGCLFCCIIITIIMVKIIIIKLIGLASLILNKDELTLV